MMSDTVDAKPAVKDVQEDQTDAKPQSGQYGVTRMTDAEFQSDVYKMDYPSRGTAIIFNNKTFHPRTAMGERLGTDADAKAMQDLLIRLGFKGDKIIQHNDVTVSDMKAILQKAGKENHTDSDCFVCVILSHGAEGYVYGTDDKVSVDDLVMYFKGDKCPTLAGKPKLFFIQACRDTATAQDYDGREAQPGLAERRIPTEADFLLAYSVIPGSYAWKTPGQGSWFIQAVVDVFKNSWQKLDVMSMMTRVNRKVAHEFESKQPKMYMRYEKRIPCITCMLTKEMYFKANK